MKGATLRTLLLEIQTYLAEHPEHGDLPVYVPYDSRVCKTTVYGGISFDPEGACASDNDGCIVIDGDS